MAFATGPFQSPDEENHFLRAYQISQGQLTPMLAKYSNGWIDAGGIVPASLRDTSRPFQRMEFHPNEKVHWDEWLQAIRHSFTPKPEEFAGFQNTAIYPPVSYVPQILAIWLTKPLAVSPLVMMYAGRVLNLVIWGLMVFVAIRLIPVQKWVIVLVSLMPMSIFLAASLSSDPLITSMSLLFFALVIKARLGPHRITLIQKLAMALLAVGLGLAKIGYAPLAALVVLVPAAKLGGTNRKLLFCFIVIGCGALASLGWLYLIQGLTVTREWTNPPFQISFIEHSPAAYLLVLARTVTVRGPGILEELVGILGWLDTPLSGWIYWSYPVVAILAALSGDLTGNTVQIWERIMMIIIVILCAVVVATSVFIMWTQPGTPFVAGTQGRYFLPLIVPALVALQRPRLILPAAWRARFISSYCAIVLLSTCVTVVERYY